MIICVLSCLASVAQADDTGWRTTGTIVSSTDWTNFTTERLNTSDNSQAITTETTYGVCSTYGFTIPTGATIDGIEVQVEGRSSTADAVNCGVALSWNNGTNWTTEKTDSFTSNHNATNTFGGATDTWGRTWTASEFADANFQFRIHKVSGTPSLHIDFIQMRVLYALRTISGGVFEDVNCGGGAGRNWAAASGDGGSARSDARVELFDGAGAFVTSTTTDASGTYAFTGLAAGNYTVRIVSSSVTSSRTGYVAGLLPVQTFRTNASSGTAVDVTDYVGGHDPATADAGNAAAGWNLNAATGAFSGSGSGKAHAFAPVTVSAADVAGVDFGWSFDAVVNTNDSGQGSLRQFLTNANTLGGDAALVQSGLVAAKENAVFMISNGTTAAGLRTAHNYFGGGAATINPASALPIISAPMALDAQKQPGWADNGNKPVVVLDGNNLAADGLVFTSTADGSTIRGLVIRDFGGDGIEIQTGSSGHTIAGNYVGRLNILGTDAGAGEEHAGRGLVIGGSDNTIGGSSPSDRNVISGNLANALYILGTGNIIQGNYIGVAADGSTALGNTSDAIWVVASNNIIGGIVANEGNVIANSLDPTATGVWVSNGATGVAILGNSIYNIPDIGIELDPVFGSTPNDLGDADTGPNDLMNFPVIYSATLSGGNVTITGEARPGALVEFFQSTDAAGDHGEGKTFIGRGTVGVSGTGGTEDPSAVQFSFTFAAGALATTDRVTATATDGSNNTSEFGANVVLQPLSIVKRAFELDGTPVSSGTVLPKGTVFKFLLYINNPGAAVSDVSLSDALDAAFECQNGSILYDNSQLACASGTCTPAEEASIFNAANAGTTGTDAIDGDPVSRAATTIHVGNENAANAQLDIVAGRVFATVFTCRMR